MGRSKTLHLEVREEDAAREHAIDRDMVMVYAEDETRMPAHTADETDEPVQH